MPERKDLTIRVKADTKGLRQIRDESAKASRAVQDTGRRTISTFSQLDRQLQNVAVSVAKVGTLVGAAFAVGGIALFTKALFDAGVEAERAETRIAAIFRTTREQAREAFQALEQFAAPLPVTTQEIVQGFIQLSAINLDPTEENLRALTSAALATTRSVDDLANVVASMETEPLRNLGIQLERTGETAVLAFGPDIRKEVANTDRAIRQGLLELFAEAFPNAIREAQDTYEASMSVLGSVTQSFLTTGGIALKDSIKDIVQEIAGWLEENEKLIRQGITIFARDLATGIALTVDVTRTLIQGMGGLGTSMRPVRSIFINFTELLITATDAAISLNQALINIQEFALNVGRNIDLAPQAFGPLGPLVAGIRRLTGSEGIERAEQGIEDLRQKNADLIQTANQLDAALQKAKRSFDENTESVADLDFTAKSVNEVLEILRQNMGKGVPQSAEAADKAINNFNESLRKQIENLQVQVATFGKTDKEVVNLQASLLRTKGASAELVEQFKDLSLELIGLEQAAEKAQKIEQVNESLRKELENVNRQILLFGKSDQEVARIEEILNLSAGASKELAAALADAKIQLANMKDFAEAFSDVVVTDTSGWELVFPDARRAGEDIGETFGESLTKGMLDEIRNTLADNLERIFLRETRGIVDIFKNLGRSVVSIFSQTFANSLVQGFTTDDGAFSFSKGIDAIGNLFSSGFDGLKSAGSSFGNLLSGAGGILSNIKGIAKGLFDAIPVIGTVISAGFALFDTISGLFKDRPRFDVEVFHIGNEDEIAQNIADGIAFTVSDVIRLGFDEAFRTEQIFVKGKGGAEDIEGAETVRRLVTDALTGTVDQIFGIINELPSEIASSLRDTFRNTELTFRQLIDDVSLEFDEGSSKVEEVQERFQQFIQGDLQARFLDTIDSFFVSAFESLGVVSGSAQEFVESQLSRIRTTESRTERARLGQEFLEDFQTFVDAFNIVSGNLNNEAGQALNRIQTLSEELGFSFIPSIDQITQKLDEGLSTLSLDADTVKRFVELREAIISLTVSVSQSVVSISNTIEQLNTDIVNLGGTAQGTAGSIRQAIDNIKSLLQNESLSVDERQGLLLQLNQLADALFNATAQSQQNLADQQRQNIETRIESLREERTVIEETFRIRIDALNEELRIAQSFARLTDTIGDDLRRILTGTNSVLTPVEQVSLLQSEITDLQQSLNLAGSAEERLNVAEDLRSVLLDLFDVGGGAFQPGSPEFFALFSEVTGELENLQDVTANSSRSVEEINAEIESLTAQNNQQLQSIDRQIERLQNINITTGTQTNAEVRELKEFVREQLFGVLDTRTELLDSLQLQQENITVLEQIRDILASPDKGSGGGRVPGLDAPQPFNPNPGRPIPVEVTNTDDTQPDRPFNPFAFTQPAATGFDQIVRRPTLFMAGEAGPEHVQVTPGGDAREVTVKFHHIIENRGVTSANHDPTERFIEQIRTGKVGAVIEERVRKAIK